MRELTNLDFRFHGSGEKEYVTLRDQSTKNHRGDTTETDEIQGGRLYAVPNNVLCPVKSIEKYISVLNPNCDSFWQWQRRKSLEIKIWKHLL